MSYSYYLVYGIVGRALMVLLPRSRPGGIMADWLFWSLMPFLFLLTLVSAAALFVWIEKPVSLRPTLRRAVPAATAV